MKFDPSATEHRVELAVICKTHEQVKFFKTIFNAILMDHPDIELDYLETQFKNPYYDAILNQRDLFDEITPSHPDGEKQENVYEDSWTDS